MGTDQSSTLPEYPSHDHKSPTNLVDLRYLLLLLLHCTAAAGVGTNTEFPEISDDAFSEYCHGVVVPSPPLSNVQNPGSFLPLHNAYFSFLRSTNSDASARPESPPGPDKFDARTLTLVTHNVFTTQNATLFKVQAVANIRAPLGQGYLSNSNGRRLLEFPITRRKTQKEKSLNHYDDYGSYFAFLGTGKQGTFGKSVSPRPEEDQVSIALMEKPLESDGSSPIFPGIKNQGYFGEIDIQGQRRRGLRLVHYRPPKIPARPVRRHMKYQFFLTGYWDSASGKLCMIGSGLDMPSSVNAILKLDYLNSSSLYSSLVNGTLQGFDGSNKESYFKPIAIVGVSLRNYEYKLIDQVIEKNEFKKFDELANVSLGLDFGQSVCSVIRQSGVVNLEYMSNCSSGLNCNFLGGYENGRSFLPRMMSFNEIECGSDGRVRYLLEFANKERNGIQMPFDPNTTLVAEGKWDSRKRRLDMVGCTTVNGSIGDCSARLSLRFPATWTLRERSLLSGEMWSSKSVNESGYFGRVVLRSRKNMNMRLKGLKYAYTEIDNAKKLCARKLVGKGKGGKYPVEQSSDMRFGMIVRDKKGKEDFGYTSPLFVGDKIYQRLGLFAGADESTSHLNQKASGMINVSYVLHYQTLHSLTLAPVKSVEISAEGQYDSRSGQLCLVGCMHVLSVNGSLVENSSLDCEILVDVQYPQLKAKSGNHVRGTIQSVRKKSDPLYFEPLEIITRSIYADQAKDSIWRMDLEITMVLISNTLACIFVGLQLFYVKRHPDVLPLISIMMLVALTLAHMIPLLLNFEALFFANRNRQNVYLGTDGWLEVNEVLVRVITMIAFLLEFRLLQVAWSARVADGSQDNLWVSDKKVLYLSLPLYIGGGLIAWFVHILRKSHQTPLPRWQRFGYQQISLWGDLKSYGGLILDGFLLPQILFNLFCDSKEKALTPSFYVGTTLVRLLPHAYDLYRAHSSTWSLHYIYANPKMDYYSTAWDIIISFGGLLFVLLICLQQRFGGRCILPKRFRQNSAYEKVPAVGA